MAFDKFCLKNLSYFNNLHATIAFAHKKTILFLHTSNEITVFFSHKTHTTHKTHKIHKTSAGRDLSVCLCMARQTDSSFSFLVHRQADRQTDTQADSSLSLSISLYTDRQAGGQTSLSVHRQRGRSLPAEVL